MVDFSEDGPNASGQLKSIRSNIVWNPAMAGYTNYLSFFKAVDMGNGATQDVCAVGMCDYNTGWNQGTGWSKAGSWTNSSSGYLGNFSSKPGTHDRDVDPQFLDWQRNAALFDSKYLGNTANPWNRSSKYNVGDFVASADSSTYWNLSVNYRYTNGPGCVSANPRPGVDPEWRRCWEWATLFRIRAALASNQVISDTTIGVQGESLIVALIRWLQAGYSPTNAALRAGAHDGSDIGAMPVRY
jgi:hypothetical protein